MIIAECPPSSIIIKPVTETDVNNKADETWPINLVVTPGSLKALAHKEN